MYLDPQLIMRSTLCTCVTYVVTCMYMHIMHMMGRVRCWWTSLIFSTGAAGAVTLPLLSCLPHVYLFIEINCLIQGLVMQSTRLSITILPGKVSASHPAGPCSSSRQPAGLPLIAGSDQVFIDGISEADSSVATLNRY